MVSRISAILLLLLVLLACEPSGGAPRATAVPTGTAVRVAPPTATVQATAVPTPRPRTPTAGPPRQRVILDAPQTGGAISSPVEVRGRVSVMPFEANLVGRVYDGQDRMIGQAPIQVLGDYSRPGPFPFAGRIDFSASAAGPGRVEVADISMKDGSVIAAASVEVVLRARSGG